KVADAMRPKARKLLEDAITRDPKFVLAYCLLSQVQATPNWAEESTPEQLAEAEASAQAAVRLAPESGEAHLALANIYYGEYYGAHKDRQRALEELSIAARTLPNSPEIVSALGDVAKDRGQWKEALRNLEKAMQLDPRNADIAIDLIDLYIDLRQYREAELLTDRMIAGLPPASTMNFWAGKYEIALQRGNLKAARAAMEASPNHNTGSTTHNHNLAVILLRERRYADAVTLIDQIPERARKGNVLPGSGINPFAEGLYAQSKAVALRAEGQVDQARLAFEASRAGFVSSRHDDLEILVAGKGGLGPIDLGVGIATLRAKQLLEIYRRPLRA
ncbi:MAG: tetratricopeptide repeat protein, partial [Bryobacteraceae bacterium]